MIHVAVSLAAVGAGTLAAFSRKGPGRHPAAGRTYVRAVWGVVATAAALTGFRPHEDWPLLALGVGALAAALVGRAVRRRARPGWRRLHIPAMGASMVLLLTAFYVDNGPHLPLWRALPPWTMWVLPAAVGTPLVLRSLARYR